MNASSRPGSDPRRAVLQHLESLGRAGVEQIGSIPQLQPSHREPVPPRQTAEPAPDANQTAAAKPLPSQSPAENPLMSTPRDPANALRIVEAEVAKCTLCPELCSTRTNTVFGTGNPRARLIFMGEAPGADEDRQGEPFVGRAGQLLTKIIEAMDLKREDVYILNTLKCRPPGNRNPSPDEIANCRSYFERQLDILQPEFLCCLGAIAAQGLLETTTTIGRLRGSFHDYRGIRVVATYHPAYLLRNPSAKRHVWEDMQMLLREMGLPIPDA